MIQQKEKLKPIVFIGGCPARHHRTHVEKYFNVGRMLNEPEFTFKPVEIYRVFKNRKWQWLTIRKK